MVGLGPIRTKKLPYHAVEVDEESDFSDVEKQGATEDSEYETSPPASHSSRWSSQSTNDSHSPLFKRRPRAASAYEHHHTNRRSFNRYFTIILGTIIIVVVITLVRLSWTSAKHIQDKEPLPPPPAVWESFPFLKRYHGGIRTLVPKADNIPEYPTDTDGEQGLEINSTEQVEKPTPPGEEDDQFSRRGARKFPTSSPYNPYPKYSSKEYEAEFEPVVECSMDEQATYRIPMLQAYPGVVSGMPDPVLGSYELLGLRNDLCFERYGRLGPYGFGYGRAMGGSGAGLDGEREGAEAVWEKDLEVDYRQVRWSEAQARCAKANTHRFKPGPTARENAHSFLSMNEGGLSSPSSGFVAEALVKRSEWKDEDGLPEPAAMDPSTAALARKQHTGGFGDESALKGTGRTTNHPTENPEGAEATSTETPVQETKVEPQDREPSAEPAKAKRLLPRTAVVIRTWWDYDYDPEDLFYLRALITELSLLSGGEYHVHFLIHVKDDNRSIWADDYEYQKVLDQSLPAEFRGMGTLWSERQMLLVYGGLAESFYRGLPVHGAYRSAFMPMGYFAHKHPEYDFFWHWEMDVRYTGHFYELFTKVSEWAKQQPRKGLWERNARFYVPKVHGTWEDFKHMVRIQTDQGTATHSVDSIYGKQQSKGFRKPVDLPKAEKPIWGPEPPLWDNLDLSASPKPPTSYAKDNFVWGVGEEADLITFNPLFDPDQTGWLLAEDVTGYNMTDPNLVVAEEREGEEAVVRGKAVEPDSPPPVYPPRRTAIITASRLSKRLLAIMHEETWKLGHTMFSEMWPGSVALQHGLKAVYVPHPVYIDRKWPVEYLAATFNNGRNGASGGAKTSPFNDRLQHNFLGITWYYHAGFPGDLWRRWLGYKVNNDGGEEWEMRNEGRICLPPMLLHPVKQVDLVYEHREEEAEPKGTKPSTR